MMAVAFGVFLLLMALAAVVALVQELRRGGAWEPTRVWMVVFNVIVIVLLLVLVWMVW